MSTHASLRLWAFAAAAGLASAAFAQGTPASPAPATPPATPAPAAAAPISAAPAPVAVATPQFNTGDPRRDTLLRLMRPISVDFQDKRVEDVMTFIKDYSGADIEPLWADDQNGAGLDREKTVSVKVTNGSVLSLLEKVAEKARGDGSEITWQTTDTGTFQYGPKERLNKFRRVEIYDINDLLQDVPDYRDVPQIDLQQALQAAQGGGGGGGGGKSPFKEEQNRTQQQIQQDREERSKAITQIITDLVENEQWVDNGGSGGTIRYYRGTLIVNAPDYMHRGIDGYRWWPSTATRSSVAQGRRYVTLTTDNGLARVLGFGQQPVSAVVGGKVIRSGGPGGGGR
jgi:hypothetical protein